MNYSEMIAELNAKHGTSDEAERAAALRATPAGRTAVAIMQGLIPILGEMQQRIRELEARPIPKWCGGFKQGQVYRELSFVVADGALWVSNRAPCSAQALRPIGNCAQNPELQMNDVLTNISDAKPLDDDDSDDGLCIRTQVGSETRLVPINLYLDTHAEVAMKFRAAGLVHGALDEADHQRDADGVGDGVARHQLSLSPPGGSSSRISGAD